MESCEKTTLNVKHNLNLVSHYEVNNKDLKEILINALNDNIYTSDNHESHPCQF
jgi:hypothetical protein